MPTAIDALRSCVAPLLGYASALAASLGLMILIAAGIAAQSSSNAEVDPADEIDIEAIGTLIGMPFQIAGMALGGSIGLGDDDFGASLFAPPLLVTAVFTVITYLLSRCGEKRTPAASAGEAAILAVIGAIATATVVTVATRVLAMRSDGAVLHATTVGLFFGVFALAFAAALLGRLSARETMWPFWVATDARLAAHLVTQHVLVWVVVVAPAAAIWLLVETGVEGGLFALAWGPTLAFWGFGLGHLGALTAWGESEFVWGIGLVPGLVLPLLAVLLALMAATAWHLRRGDDRDLLVRPVSWVPLPIAYAVVALMVCVLSTVGASGRAFGTGGGFTIHPAYWLIPVLAVWGAVVEVLSRYAAPALADALPGRVTARLARTPASLTAGHGTPASPPGAVAERAPMTAAEKARVKKILIGGGALVALVVAAVVTVGVIGSTRYSPEKQAEAYLDAVMDSDLDTALDLAPVAEDEGGTGLLTEEIYSSAENRVTGYEITDVEELGDTVIVNVDLEGIPDGDEAQLTLETDGRRAVFFDEWKVTEGGLATLVHIEDPDGAASLAVNGTPIDHGGRSDLWALPGSYTFDPYAGNEWVDGTSATTTVAPGSFGTYAEVGAPAPSQELQDAVTEQVEGWINGCMGSTEPEPEDCPQDAYTFGDDYRNLTWELTRMPTISWDFFDGTFPADVYMEDGEATATYEYDESYGFGQPEWVEETETSTLYEDLVVDIVDDEPKVSLTDD